MARLRSRFNKHIYWKGIWRGLFEAARKYGARLPFRRR